ncbi:MAG: hypothetical protein C0609_07125 [Deltaproteobacteria bacterium]|nr:MAG: hypothetical protein C0609_07125 [Deltaproteobacteria bacterium]
MSKKIAVASLIAALTAFGYLFWLNPGQVDFVLYPGGNVKTSHALILFLFFLTGFALALLISAFREAWSSFVFWRHKRADERKGVAENLLEKSKGSMAHGDASTARKLLDRARRISPERATIAMELARAEIAEGKFDKAERRMRALLETHPTNPEVISLNLEVSRAKGDFEGQIAALKRWLELDPKHLRSLTALRDLYVSAGSYSEAARVQEKIIASTGLKPSELSAERQRLNELKMSHAATLEGAAAESILLALANDGGYAPAYARLGRIYAARGDFEQAEKLWVKGYKSTDKLSLLLYAENSMRSRNKADQMLPIYKKFGKRSQGALLLRARLLVSLGRNKEAIEYLLASSGALNTPYGKWLLGEANFAQGEYEKAARAYRSGLGGGELPLLPFTCSACGAKSPNYATDCNACKSADCLDFTPELLSYE